MNLVSRIGFYTVTVSKTQITYNGWTGVGYIIIDPSTGASAFEISGGLSGSGNTQKSDPLVDLLKGTFDGSAMGVLDAFIQALKISSKTVTNLYKWTNGLLIGLSALFMLLNVYYKTGSPLKGFEAGIVDLLFSILSSLVIGSIVAFLGGGFLITIVVTIVIATLTVLLENFILKEAGLALLELIKKYCVNKFHPRYVYVS
ncbi:MAG: hypothetical protein M1381_09785 [Deltaproteobacteria bacterium]|nr:hypothetical protein [Deltaproteobacteria bacterium]